MRPTIHHVDTTPTPTSPTDVTARTDKGKARATSPTPSRHTTSSPPSSSTPSYTAPRDSQGSTEDNEEAEEAEDGEDEDEEWCLICHTAPIADRAVLPRCLHAQFCFGCIVRWVSIKRRCPLCLANVGDFIIHGVRADDDYVRYHLPPPPLLPSSSAASTSTLSSTAPSRRAVVAEVQAARSARRSHGPSPSAGSAATADEAEEEVVRALERRRYIYRHELFAKHVGSNRHTQYRPCPTPAHVRHSSDTARRIKLFLKRELSLWPQIDADFLTTYMLSLLQVFTIDADETVRLTSEFLGERTARHVLHELECFLRSGKRKLRFYDASPYLQYPPPRAATLKRRRERERERAETAPGETEEGSKRRRQVARRREVLLSRLERERALLDTS